MSSFPGCSWSGGGGVEDPPFPAASPDGTTASPFRNATCADGARAGHSSGKEMHRSISSSSLLTGTTRW